MVKPSAPVLQKWVHWCPGSRETSGLLQGPLPPGLRTQTRVEAAGMAVRLLQVLTVRVQLPGVPEVLHEGLHQARRREEVVTPVAVVIPAQAARLPLVDRGQLQGEADHLGARGAQSRHSFQSLRR